MVLANLASRNELRYKFQVRRNGVVISERPWVSNLIQDCGMDQVAGNYWCSLITYMAVGSAVSPVPVRRDSNAVTISIASHTATASGSYFQAGDVGRILKLNDVPGTERYITGFTNSTAVTLGGAVATVPPINGTVWYVNETAMTSQLSSAALASTDGGANGTSWAGNVATYKKTIILPAVSSGVVLTEIAFSVNGVNVNVFDRDVITGGVALSPGDQPSAIVELIKTIIPATAISVGNVATGYDSSGMLQVEAVQSGFALTQINTNGSVSGGAPFLEAPQDNNGQVGAISSTFTLQAFSIAPGPSAIGTSVGFTTSAYTPGSFFVDKLFGFSVSQANYTIYGLSLVLTGSRCVTLLLTTPFTKLSTQILTGSWRYSWFRVLVN